MNRNRTQEEIDFDMESLMALEENLNLGFHDNCDMNTCNACCPIIETRVWSAIHQKEFKQ